MAINRVIQLGKEVTARQRALDDNTSFKTNASLFQPVAGIDLPAMTGKNSDITMVDSDVHQSAQHHKNLALARQSFVMLLAYRFVCLRVDRIVSFEARINQAVGVCSGLIFFVKIWRNR